MTELVHELGNMDTVKSMHNPYFRKTKISYWNRWKISMLYWIPTFIYTTTMKQKAWYQAYQKVNSRTNQWSKTRQGQESRHGYEGVCAELSPIEAKLFLSYTNVTRYQKHTCVYLLDDWFQDTNVGGILALLATIFKPCTAKGTPWTQRISKNTQIQNQGVCCSSRWSQTCDIGMAHGFIVCLLQILYALFHCSYSKIVMFNKECKNSNCHYVNNTVGFVDVAKYVWVLSCA